MLTDTKILYILPHRTGRSWTVWP